MDKFVIFALGAVSGFYLLPKLMENFGKAGGKVQTPKNDAPEETVDAGFRGLPEPVGSEPIYREPPPVERVRNDVQREIKLPEFESFESDIDREPMDHNPVANKFREQKGYTPEVIEDGIGFASEIS